MSPSEAREPDHGLPPSFVSAELSPEAEGISAVSTEPETGRSGWGQVFRALRHRNFRLFAAGQTISLMGTFMQTVAQSWLVYRLTRSEWLLGATWFCTQIPVFILGPLGGLAADRHSRHRIVVLTQILSMIQALLLAVLTLTGTVQVWHVMVLAATLGVINAFDMPGRQSLIIQMTGKKDLLSAIALNSAIFNMARVVGPAVAGVVVAAVGEGLCFLANAISYVAVIASLLAMRLPKFVAQARESPWAHLVNGFRYAYGQPAIKSLLTMVAATNLSGIPVMVLMPFFADEIFHRGSQGLGFLTGAMGIGAVIGTLVLARRTKTSGLIGVIFLGALSFGVSFLVLAWSPSFYLALAIMPVIGFSIMRHNASANTLIQTLIPDEYRGRIMALYSMTVVGIGPFGSLATGALAGHFGVRATVVFGGLLCILAAILFRLRVRNLPELK
ncbi:MAG: MFS transporter [Rhodospirillales bacterium]